MLSEEEALRLLMLDEVQLRHRLLLLLPCVLQAGLILQLLQAV
jgi:hypothetical protein